MPPRPVRATILACALLVAATGCSAAEDQAPDAASSAPAAPTTDGDPEPQDQTTTLPDYDASSAAGDLATDFPAKLVPVPTGAEVLASSAGAPDEGTTLVRITLNLRSTDSVKDITSFYTAALEDAGFEVSPSTEASALTALTTFVRAHGDDASESVAVGVFDDEDERLVTISGQVAAS